MGAFLYDYRKDDRLSDRKKHGHAAHDSAGQLQQWGLRHRLLRGWGTTLGAAQELGRRWTGADNSPESLSAVIRRFSDGLQDYGDYVSRPFDQPELSLKTGKDDTCFPIFTEQEKVDEALSVIRPK